MTFTCTNVSVRCRSQRPRSCRGVKRCKEVRFRRATLRPLLTVAVAGAGGAFVYYLPPTSLFLFTYIHTILYFALTRHAAADRPPLEQIILVDGNGYIPKYILTNRLFWVTGVFRCPYFGGIFCCLYLWFVVSPQKVLSLRNANHRTSSAKPMNRKSVGDFHKRE